jgi:hypothetical protein
MDFSFNNSWGTDEVYSTTPMNYRASVPLYTESAIEKEVKWPVPKYKFPESQAPQKVKITKPQTKESFSLELPNNITITENMLILFMLIVLVVFCAVIYKTVKDTCETLKIVMSLLIAKK